MKRIVIMQKDKGQGEELASCLKNIFPECEIQVLRKAGAQGKAVDFKKEGGDPENSKNTGGG
jgi:hypothetical protein